MGQSYFVTGTDTDAGKTFITCGLLEAAKNQNLTTIALKPVAAGCDHTSEGLRNDDAVNLIEAMTCELPYSQVNPVALKAPIAPHIAASEEGRTISLDRLTGFCRGALMKKYDIGFIEGAGGWRVPINNREMLSGLAGTMNAPVILVVGMKLGCISHTMLTVESILRDGCKLAGWVANQIDPDMSRFRSNVETLESMIPAPCLGVVPWLSEGSSFQAASFLDISPLLN